MATAASSYLPDGAQTAPSVAATLLFVINIMRKVSCTLPFWFHMWRGEKAQGFSPPMRELIARPASPPTQCGGAGSGRVGASRVLLLVLAFLKLAKTIPYIPREKRMGEIT